MTFLRLVTGATIGVIVALVLGRATAPSATGIIVNPTPSANVARVVDALRVSGLTYLRKPGDISRYMSTRPDVLVLTRGAGQAADARIVGQLYAEGTLIVGLDLSRRDLEIAIYGSSSRPQEPRDPERPFLTMVYWRQGCGAGSFSDVMDHWPAARLIMGRATELALGCQDRRRGIAAPD